MAKSKKTRRAGKNKAARLVRGTGKAQFLYQQVSALLRKDIEEGRLHPGDMLPSMDDIATQFGINKATVMQAIADLASAGLVYTVAARGTFVVDPAESRKKNDPERPLAIGWVSTVTDGGNTGRYHTELMDQARLAIQQGGDHLLVFCSDGIAQNVFCKMVLEAKLDGAIFVGPAQMDPIRKLLSTGLPSVTLDDRAWGRRADSIVVDNEAGGHQAIEHLVSLGHRKLALVTGPQAWKVTRDRQAGALLAAKEAGIAENQVEIIESDFTPRGGYTAVRHMLAVQERPTGVFFFNDEMASGALQALYVLSGLKVPDDISIVGYDDIAWASLTHPPLTTVHIEKELMGRYAVEQLKQAIADRNRVPIVTVVPPRLVVRNSTGPVKS
jgi:DNA-binding LacI/PurR family transcriptional regulator